MDSLTNFYFSLQTGQSPESFLRPLSTNESSSTLCKIPTKSSSFNIELWNADILGFTISWAPDTHWFSFSEHLFGRECCDIIFAGFVLIVLRWWWQDDLWWAHGEMQMRCCCHLLFALRTLRTQLCHLHWSLAAAGYKLFKSGHLTRSSQSSQS